MHGVTPDLEAPHQVKLRGKWALTKNHDLKMTLDKWRRQRPGDELTLQGEIIAAKDNSLLFAFTTRSKKKLASVNVLRLQGIWQADKYNRLIFRVKKGQGLYDTLIFDGIWEIDKQHRIIYHYEKTQLTRTKRRKRTLTFKGYWNIAKPYKLSYELGLDGSSAFEFSGKWKINKNTGLLFEVDCKNGRFWAIAFGAEARLAKKGKVEFKLKNNVGKDLGLQLKLSRKIFQDSGQAFIRLLKSKEKSGIYVGLARRW
jgi:hypothetical protein